MVDVYTGAVTGQKPPKSKLLRQLAGTYKASVYKYYKSHTQDVNKFNFEANVQEVKADDRANVLKSPFFRYVIPIMIIVMLYSIDQVYSYFTRFNGKENEQMQVQDKKDEIEGEIKKNEVIQRYNNSIMIAHQSKELRIVGIVNTKVLIQDANSEVFEISSRKCLRASKFYPSFHCIINDEIVTFTSGIINDRDYRYTDHNISNERREYDIL
jgi:zona occludens toxin